jgi:hypothetical protein
MARQVREILGLLGAAQAAAVQVYPLDVAGDGSQATADDAEAIDRARAWASVWGADFGPLTAAITPAEKDALVAAGARELLART